MVATKTARGIAIKEKAASIGSNVSGITSILGSWQICHTICLAIIALLAAIGITLTTLPLAFLINYSTPLWLIAAALSTITLLMYLKRPCISPNTLLFQSGILIFGIPFQSVQKYAVYFRIIGALIILASIIIFIDKKIKNKNQKRKK